MEHRDATSAEHEPEKHAAAECVAAGVTQQQQERNASP
jgi:hypothetical protein